MEVREMPYRMSKFPYGYIDEISGEMLRVGKTRYGNWLVRVKPEGTGIGFGKAGAKKIQLYRLWTRRP